MISEKIEDAIIIYDNFIPNDICKKFIQYSDKMCQDNLGVLSDQKNYRIVKGYSLSKKLISDKIIYSIIYNYIYNFYAHYKIKFPQISTNKLSQIDLLKYKPGGKYEAHTDHCYHTPRTLSVIINLNDNYEGGNLVFLNQNLKTELKRIILKKGSIVCFPSNFLYPLKIEPITKGVRYSIVSWLL